MQAHAIPSFILVGLIAKHASFLSKSSRRKQSSKLLNVNQSSLWWKFQSENFAASLNLSHFSIHSVKLLSHNPIPRSKKCQTSIYFHLDNFSIFMESISSQIKLPPYVHFTQPFVNVCTCCGGSFMGVRKHLLLCENFHRCRFLFETIYFHLSLFI